MTPALRDAIREADGVGQLQRPEGDDPAGVGGGRGEHPVCGDEIEVEVLLRDGRIEELAFRARGCPATLAVGAVLRRALRGAEPADAPERLRDCLQRLGGLARHERHAERIALEALEAAVVEARGQEARGQS